MPDATYGAVKTLTTEDLKTLGLEALVTTTLHLDSHIGTPNLLKHGGMHKLMNWPGVLVSDSGGFQVFSLIHSRKHLNNKISEFGCSFIDPATGTHHLLTPESSQLTQHAIGSDIRVVLDEPTPVNATAAEEKLAVERTTRWAKRSKEQFLKILGITESEFNNPSTQRPLLCCVVQGGNNFELRRQSALELAEIGFDVYGFGGAPMLKQITWKDDERSGSFYKELLALVGEIIPQDKLRYALGVGTPDDITYCVSQGWQLFDTVLPTRNARHGYLYMPTGAGDKERDGYSIMHIRTKRYEFDQTPINSTSKFVELRETSRSYLRHLIRTQEAAGHRLATLHNLEFYQDLMAKLIA